MTQKIVIVGGVGGGSTVASQIRRLDQQAEIILLDERGEIAFSNCGMPYYIGDVISERDKLIPDPEKFARKTDVDVRLYAKVTAIDRKNKQITYQQSNENQEETYDALILAPGASATVPPVNGIAKHNSFTLRFIPDMDQINRFIEENNPKTCVIVGGGFVGLEMVENLQEKGINCTIIDRSKHLMKTLDPDMAEILHDHAGEKGVSLRLQQSVDGFSNNGHTVHTSSGEELHTDMTILSSGVKPNTELAENASLSLGETGAITVNDFMQTSDPSIYALGDAIEIKDYLTGKPRNVALAPPAHRQAFIIANHLSGTSISYKGSVGTSILKLFELTIGSTGNTSDRLQQANIDFQTATHNALSNAGYYPGAEKISIKILFETESGKLLGGQVVGKKDVDKRLAVLATAINGGMTIADLTELELGYAPPYSSPKDPINTIGYKALAQMSTK